MRRDKITKGIKTAGVLIAHVDTYFLFSCCVRRYQLCWIVKEITFPMGDKRENNSPAVSVQLHDKGSLLEIAQKSRGR